MMYFYEIINKWCNWKILDLNKLEEQIYKIMKYRLIMEHLKFLI